MNVEIKTLAQDLTTQTNRVYNDSDLATHLKIGLTILNITILHYEETKVIESPDNMTQFTRTVPDLTRIVTLSRRINEPMPISTHDYSHSPFDIDLTNELENHND